MFAMKEIQPTAAQAARRALELQSKKVAQLRREADEAGTPGYRLSVMRDDLGKRRAQMAAAGSRAEEIAAALGDEEQKIAYVKLSGGCQGCAMSRMTLSQGIETSLREAIPTLTGVVDVTDHASGVNPFYANEQ